MKLITVSGPHGAGKEEVVTRLLQAFPCLSRIVPYTSRARRPSEVEGREYYFVSNEAFLQMLVRGEFVTYGKIRNHHSGTTHAELLSHNIACFRYTHMAVCLVDILGGIHSVFCRPARSVQDHCSIYSIVSVSVANPQGW